MAAAAPSAAALQWVSDELISLLGFGSADATLAEFFFELARGAPTAAALVSQLERNGLPAGSAEAKTEL